MILLLSPYQNAEQCAAQIKRATRDEVKTVNTLKLALAALRSHPFDLVVADENLLESTPGSAESLLQRMETAAPLVLDLAMLRPEKVAKLAQAARTRRDLDFQLAREKALAELRSDLKSELTGLLISSELALKTADLPARAGEQLNAVLEIARRMESRLGAKAQ